MIYTVKFPENRHIDYWDYQIKGNKLFAIFEWDERVTTIYVCPVEEGVDRVKTIFEQQLVGKGKELIIEI